MIIPSEKLFQNEFSHSIWSIQRFAKSESIILIFTVWKKPQKIHFFFFCFEVFCHFFFKNKHYSSELKSQLERLGLRPDKSILAGIL